MKKAKPAVANCDKCGRPHYMVIKKNTGCPCAVSRCRSCEFIHGPLNSICTVSDGED